MYNRWELKEEVKQKFTPVIEEFIGKVESNYPKGELLSIDLSDTELNPFTLSKLLENMGYKETDVDRNGWQMDFWITMEKEKFKTLQITGTGITFELILSEKE